MGKIIKIYKNNPDSKSINQIVAKLEQGAIIIFPTDSYYSFGCSLNCQKAINAIIKLKEKKDKNLSIICSDIKMASRYININDENFRILKQNTPKPITFIFDLNKRFPNPFFECKKTVGIRIVDNNITQEIVERLGVPIVSTTVALRNATQEDSIDPSLIWDEYGSAVDILVDAGIAPGIPTMVIDLTGEEPNIIRESDVEFTL